MSNFNSEITSDDKLSAALAYFFSPLGPIIIMLMEDRKNRPFIRAHNAQALVLGVISVALGMLTFGCGSLLVVLYLIYLAYQAYQGQMVEVPVITKFCKDQGWA
jgi:uncharacterized membrane protein